MLKGKNIVWIVVGVLVLLVLASKRAAQAGAEVAPGSSGPPGHSRHAPEVTSSPPLSGPPRGAPLPLSTRELRDIMVAPKTRTGATAF
jgi:hypothetical protein